jgi:hypothetical protein
MPTFYGAIDLAKNELRNAVFQNLGSAPSTPVKGQTYMNSADNTLYWYDGSQWIAAKGGAGAVPADTVTTQAVGDTAVQGVSALYSRGDHKHGREGFGVVTAETAFGSATANGSAGTLARSDHAHGNPVHNAAAHSAIPLNALAVPTNNYDLNGFLLTGSSLNPQNAGDVVSKLYVDSVAVGMGWKDSVRVASTANVATLSGTGQVIDGVTVAVADRVLLKNQTTASQNGIYQAVAGPWGRTFDAAQGPNLVGAACFVEEGTTNADTAWVCTTDAPILVGTTNITFVQFAGGGAVVAGAGMTQSGNVLNVIPGDTSLTVAADSIIVNTAIIATVAALTAAVTGMAKKFAAALTGTASPEVVTHNLNTRDILLLVYNGASPYTAVEVDWDATSVNTATIRYNPNLGSGYRVVVIG